MKPSVRDSLIGAFLWVAVNTACSSQFGDFYYTHGDTGLTAWIVGYAGPGGSVTIPEAVNGLPVTKIASGAFRDATQVRNVTIPNSVTGIGAWGFSGCTSLTSVTIFNHVTSIGDKAFSRCTSLTNITIPNSVTSIGQGVFEGCTVLTSVTIPDSVTNIGRLAFSGCTSLTHVTIPRRITDIGEGAFQNCTGLMGITVDPLNTAYSSVDGALFDKSQTTLIVFPGSKSGSYTIPNSVTSVGNHAFHGCTSLTSVTISNHVTSIGDLAFDGCSGLTSITIPNSVSSIGRGAFIRCTGLTGVTIGNSVTSIRMEAFSYCTSLANVKIGNSVTDIEDFAFYGCSSLAGVYFQGNAPRLGFIVFGGENVATLYYLPGTVGWGTTFGNRPPAFWLPQVLTADPTFGVQTNGFGFSISWASDKVVVVEAADDLTKATWTPVSTNILAGGTSYFSDPEWSKYPSRFYRVRQQ